MGGRRDCGREGWEGRVGGCCEGWEGRVGGSVSSVRGGGVWGGGEGEGEEGRGGE